MTTYPGVDGSKTWVQSSISGLQLAKGDSQYLLGVLATGASQLPITPSNVANEAALAAATQKSISVNIQPAVAGDPPPMVCVEIQYASDPGAGEQVEVQEADTDADAFYITPSNATYTITVFTAFFIARADFSPTGGKFIRVKRTKGANAVACTIRITRLA